MRTTLEMEEGNNIYAQAARWPIEDRLAKHERIFQWAEYAQKVKSNPSVGDCRIAALMEYGDCDFKMMYPGKHIGLAIGACLHDVLQGKVGGDKKELARIGKGVIENITAFIDFATMHKIKTSVQLYRDDFKKGLQLSKEMRDEVKDVSPKKATEAKRISIGASGPSEGGPGGGRIKKEVPKKKREHSRG